MEVLLKDIAVLVGDQGLITGDAVSERPADWLGQSHCRAAAVVRPRTTQELSAVMKACHTARQPVVAAGGLTGLVHGADAGPGELLVSFERMNQIEKIDPVQRTLTVQAGVRTEQAQDAAREAGLLFAIDLGARGSSTVGGNISTNAGGNQVLRYGMTRQNVLGLEAVLADGTIISSMSPLMKNNTGYDLKHLFIGSEGTLGLVTRAVFRLHPLPLGEVTAMAGVRDLPSVARFLRHMEDRLCGSLTAFEVMWRSFYNLIAVQGERHKAPLRSEFPYYVLLEAHGGHADNDQDQFSDAIGAALTEGLIEEAVIASSKRQRDALWAIREDIPGLVQALYPMCSFDVSLPIGEMEPYLAGVQSKLNKVFGETCKLVVFGHLGDGNLHLLVSPRPWGDDAQHKAEELIYQPLGQVGGSVSAEHGIGLEKKRWLTQSRSSEEIRLMQHIKFALDPCGLLNPGKIIDDLGPAGGATHADAA